MPAKSDVQRFIDSLFRQIGAEVARGVAEGLAKSGLMKNIQTPSRGAGPARNPAGRKAKITAAVKTCKVAGCQKNVYARGMCGQHFMAWVRSKKK